MIISTVGDYKRQIGYPAQNYNYNYSFKPPTVNVIPPH